jgi:hypothetical protein
VVDGREHPARLAWRTLEPFHALSYFSRETREETDAIGLRGGWMSYFACRAAPLGPVGPEVVAAAFFSFHPAMVGRSLPDAWRFAAPAEALDARLRAVDRAVRRVLPDAADSPAMRRAADRAREAADLAPVAGRVLAAANRALPWADEPHLALWQATAVLRESRGDGHVAALVTAGLSPVEALVTVAAAGGPSREVFRTFRGWSDAEWDDGARRLRERGWLGADGRLTEQGVRGRAAVERITDELAMQTWSALGEARTGELLGAVRPWSRLLLATGGVPLDNPMGMTWPADELSGQ